MSGRRTRLGLLGTAVTLLSVSGCGDRHPTDPAAAQALNVTASGMRQRIAVLSDDSMRGRLTPSAELDAAAAYAAAEFQASGLRPVPGGFVQRWDDSGVLAPNVIAVLDGSDLRLASEYVVFLAHLDHIGTTRAGGRCAAAGADSICNGADDNASGAAGVLELARAFAGLRPRPRRSLLFLLVSGEEEGLLGSVFYVNHAAVPLSRTVAALNLDMIGRNAPDSVGILGGELTSLGSLLTELARVHVELGLAPVARPWNAGGFDHRPFVLSGVAALCFHTGLHADYHRPSDTVEKIDADKAARIVRLVFYAGLDVANRTERPAWVAGVPSPELAGPTAPPRRRGPP